MNESRILLGCLKYQRDSRQQGVRWASHARKARRQHRERCAGALGLVTAAHKEFGEAVAALVPALGGVAEAFAAIDPLTLEVDMTPLERAWSWITDTYYRWIDAWRW